LISHVELPLNVELVYDYVARSPADRPILSLAVARWPSGRTRVVVGGWGQVPRLAFDALEAAGVAIAVQSACAEAEDAWASAEYRQHVALTLLKRVS
jgi:CO/xanthine dehydrogenase FAD-binding subunit